MVLKVSFALFLQVWLAFASLNAFANPLLEDTLSDKAHGLQVPNIEVIPGQHALQLAAADLGIGDSTLPAQPPFRHEGFLPAVSSRYTYGMNALQENIPQGFETLLAMSDSDEFTVNAEDTPEVMTGGAVYTRWGRSECPVGAELVYSGTAAGSGYSDTGGASNYLCMPPVPVYDEVTSANSDRAYLYPAEYRTNTGPSSLSAVNYHAPTCAVCRAPPGHTTKVMIPGRNICPSANWRLEYGGYLMAEKYTYKRSEFICMDRQMEVEPGTGGSQGGAYFYMVETRCLVGGGLPCTPYINGYELTCAVCTI